MQSLLVIVIDIHRHIVIFPQVATKMCDCTSVTAWTMPKRKGNNPLLANGKELNDKIWN